MNPNSIQIQATQNTQTFGLVTHASTFLHAPSAPPPALNSSGTAFKFKAAPSPNSQPMSPGFVTQNRAPVSVSSGFAAFSNAPPPPALNLSSTSPNSQPMSPGSVTGHSATVSVSSGFAALSNAPPPASNLSSTALKSKAATSPNSQPMSPGFVTEHSAPVLVSSGFAVLSNEDILGLIFQEVDAFFCGADLKIRNQSLLWAAQTSKAFFRPAVSILWRIIRSFVPLLKILPQFKTSNSVHVS
jgi:hypothetical protein